MRLRATLKVRNDEMLAAREAAGLNQIALAELAGVSLAVVRSLEMMDYSQVHVCRNAQRVADALCIPVDVVMPPELVCVDARMDRAVVQTVPTDRLLAAVDSGNAVKLIGYDPQYNEAEADLAARAMGLMRTSTRLNDQERSVLTERFVNGRTLEQTGAIVGPTKERVRQIQNKALGKLRRELMDDEFAPYADDADEMIDHDAVVEEALI